jgi:hypothetical protein
MENRENKPVTENKWKPTDQRYVCFIDIMGFKNMVATTKHADIYNKMKKVADFQEFNSNIAWTGNPDLVKTTTFSDSIIIYSHDDSSDSLESIVWTVSGLMHDLLSEGIPFKGAMSHGTMTCDTKNSIFFGQPLIDSYILQEELYFYGIVVHGSTEKEMKNLEDVYTVETYCCPFKKGKADHLTIYPIHLRCKEDKDINLELLKSVNKMKYYTSGHLRVYIDSTIDYLKVIDPNLADN